MQELVTGEGSIKKAGEIIARQVQDNVFLVTGKHFLQQRDLGFLQGLKYYHHIKRGSNVEEEEALEAFESFQQSRAGAILAIGGGSVIDLAKTIIYKTVKASGLVPFFIVAPTTAGSGSEATSFAVIYKNKKKESLVHPSLLPQVVILDPELTTTMSTYQAAASGMDALSQAIESYWSRNSNTDSKEIASTAISIWEENFLDAVLKKDNKAQEKMLETAHLAGKAINITRTTGPHALSYYLTATFNLPHGHAVAMLLPVFFLYNAPPKKLYALLQVKDANAAAARIRDCMSKCGLATSLSQLSIDKSAILDQWLDEVNDERFANNPTPFDRKKLRQLLDEQI